MQWLVSIIGFASVIRILVSFHSNKLFDESTLTKIGTTYFVLSMILQLSLSFSIFLLVLCDAILVLSVLYFPLFIVFTGERALLNQVSEKLRMVTLFMKLGNGFRSSFQSVVDSEISPKVKTQLVKMYRIVTFPQQKGSLFYLDELNRLTADLKFIDDLEFGALEGLEHLSYYQQVLSDFRRKSGKVRTQIQLQAVILTVLMIAVTIFMSLSFSFQIVARYLFVSSILVGVGHLISMRLGGRIKWRI